MTSTLLDARSTGSTPTLFRQMLPTLEDLQRDPSLETELLLLEAIARRRWSDSLRSGYRPASFEGFKREVLRQLLLASIPNSVEERRWRANYKLARHVARRPVRLAIQGTDFMPVRCLVVPRDNSGSWRDVQVVVQEGPSFAVTGAPIDELQVVTASSVEQLKALAVELGLALEPCVYWPKADFKRRRLAMGLREEEVASQGVPPLSASAGEGGGL